MLAHPRAPSAAHTVSHQRARVRALVAAGGACLVGLAAVPPAPASFAGPNGKIAFESARSSGRPAGIYLLNPANRRIGPLTPAAGNVQIDPAFSPSGLRVAYAEARNIAVANVDGSGVRNVTSGGFNDQQPAFAPDGRRIAFVRGDVGDIFVVNLDGSHAHDVSKDAGAQETDPAWSPNGSQIAYTRVGCAPGDETGSCVWVMNADGTGKKLLTTDDVPPGCPDVAPGHGTRYNSRQPTWAPNGSEIAFTGPPNICLDPTFVYGSDIWAMKPDGSSKRDLLEDNHTSDRQPTWSPDGTRIAFVSDRQGAGEAYQIFSVPRLGGPVARITNDAFANEDPDWGPVPRPTAIITAAVVKPAKHKARFSFVSSRDGIGFQCALTRTGRRPSFAKCTSPKRYTSLQAGDYIFHVRVLTTYGPGPARKRRFAI